MQEVAQYGDLGPTWFNTAIKSLAVLADSDKLVSSNELAKKFDIESSFIRKVLAKLMKEQFITAIGGRYGGYKLIVQPSDTTIYDVYLALVKDSYIKEQKLIENKTDQLISQIIVESENEYSKVLRRYTIEDIMLTLK
ncbi:RrF2 family transcriptional regulator [Paenibacillus endoradicis]|uniref:RrF2 family transcriptional regulator n=1 Tax=Paenibacillus endoradicis TaxID=2972487 RepID=UPI002159372E|nr:Rrf2 family transcriptional regulator [Paenibacillus endoradicis]MCR8660126.1 Rrf2 family transcriptional regulator [Paenibacillus endoradicis]